MNSTIPFFNFNDTIYQFQKISLLFNKIYSKSKSFHILIYKKVIYKLKEHIVAQLAFYEKKCYAEGISYMDDVKKAWKKLEI